MRRKIGVALCVLGVLLAIFGIVWITVIWPGLARLPADLQQQVDFQGTVGLFDADHGVTMSFDVIGHRKYTALSATKDIIYLQEDVWFEIAGTDPPQEIDHLRQQFVLGIDRVSRQNVEGHGDGVGGGHYNFPFGVSKDNTYPFWNEGNPVNLDCTFVEEKDDFHGLHVYVFQMSTPDEGLPVPASFDTPAMSIHQQVTLYVEPTSGVPVYMEEKTERKGQIPVPDELFPTTAPFTYREVTLMSDDLKFTDDTVSDLVNQANSARTQVALGKMLPWLAIGAGLVLVIAGGLLAARKASKETQSPDSGTSQSS